MENSERIELLNQALELIIDAQSMVEQAISGTGQETHFEAYGKYGFSQLLGNGNRYDSSINTLIEGLQEDENEDENEDEYEDEYEGESPHENPDLGGYDDMDHEANNANNEW